jgi:signal transduction histidine kinase
VEHSSEPLNGSDEFSQIDRSIIQAGKLISENEAHLLEAELKQEKLAHEIAEVAEAEKRRIGQDLHDDLCQRLAALKITVEALDEELSQTAPTLLKHTETIVNRMEDSILVARSIARGLSPVEIDSGGLVIALEALVRQASTMHGVRVELHSSKPDFPCLSTHIATQLFRIAQECINNAVRHGRASQAAIHLSLTAEEALEMRITNDGLPFNKDQAQQGEGMGLTIMQHRASSIGASLRFDSLSSPVTLFCTLPSCRHHPEPSSL